MTLYQIQLGQLSLAQMALELKPLKEHHCMKCHLEFMTLGQNTES
jgi:hypothetical protein